MINISDVKEKLTEYIKNHRDLHVVLNNNDLKLHSFAKQIYDDLGVFVGLNQSSIDKLDETERCDAKKGDLAWYWNHVLVTQGILNIWINTWERDYNANKSVLPLNKHQEIIKYKLAYQILEINNMEK